MLSLRYYNSRFDVPAAIKMNYGGVNRSEWYDHVTEQAQQLTKVSNILAKFLFSLATSSNNTDNIEVNETTVRFS